MIFIIISMVETLLVVLLVRGLDQQFALKLFLLLLCQEREFAHDLRVVLEAALPDDVSGLPVSLRLGDFVVLFPHVHVAGGVGGVLLAAVVEARELLLQLLGAPTDVLLPLVLPTVHAQVVTHHVQFGTVHIVVSAHELRLTDRVRDHGVSLELSIFNPMAHRVVIRRHTDLRVVQSCSIIQNTFFIYAFSLSLCHITLVFCLIIIRVS